MATAWVSTVFQWLLWVTAFTLMAVSLTVAQVRPFNPDNLQFTQKRYNASIQENSLGKTFVTPASKMGIYIPEEYPLKISYGLVQNIDDLFRVEDYVLGNFCFLLVRTHSSSFGRLNRELRSQYQLTIEAVGEDGGGNIYKTTTDLIIIVSDMNDLQPLFDHNFYNITVREDTPLHTSIASVSAYDGDEGINAEIYYSFVQRTNVFAIHPTSGIITLTRRLNYYLKSSYSLDIVAEDRGPKLDQMSKRRPVTFSVTVEKVNFFAPEISVKTLPAVVEEGQVGTVLALVSVIDRDIGDNGRIQSLQLLEEDLAGLISVARGDSSGEFIVNLVPRKGTPLPSSGFNVTLVATDSGTPPKSSNQTFYVGVLDTKEMPRFSKKIFNTSVEEIVPVNTPLLFTSIADSVTKFELKFEIVGGNKDDLFKINPRNGLVSTAGFLDAESLPIIELKVVVYDLLRAGHQTMDSAIVKIKISDSNDNAPVFTIPDNVSEIYIQENLPVGTSVFRISATDADSQENGKISFSIANVKMVPFDIDPFTGDITTTGLLDYETMRHVYKLKVRASDWGVPFSRESEMVFTITLQDVNDNEPHFEKANCSGYLSRDAPHKTELLVIPAVDFDIGNILTYGIRFGNEDGCFDIDHGTATLLLNCSLAGTVEQTRRLQVIANDGIHVSDPVDIEIALVNTKQNGQLANSNVKIQCQNTNIAKQFEEVLAMSRSNNGQTDFGFTSKLLRQIPNNNPPVFNVSRPARLQVSESSSINTVLTRLQASDQDQGYEGMLQYVIKSGDPDGHFKMDTHTGGLLVLDTLDRETRDQYQIVVEVSDLGVPRLTANMSLTIAILDENDNAPVFEQDEYDATIYENVVVNATVTQVHATDLDTGDNGEILYTILSDNDHFVVNPSNGIISVNRPLDRERYQVYRVLVRASDHGQKVSLSSTATVLVTVLDTNDNVPQFVPEVSNIRIREDLPVGAVITVVTAADTDYGNNGEVSYNLVYGAEFFEIDEETGVIRLKAQLDFEKQQVHNISVRALDGGNPPLMSACFINVEVVDVNENLMPPEFDSFCDHGYVNENEPVGTTVMFVTAHDPDGEEDMVSYAIVDGSGLGRFSIDNNGTIRTSQVLDRETTTHYWLTVYAQDYGLVPLQTRLEVYIEVKDVNDNIPMTYDPMYYASVPENDAEEGKFVARVEAFDLESNPGQHLTYQITRWDPLNFFNIDKRTGVITTTSRKLDREKQAEHILEVTVSDNGDPNLSYGARVVVKVDDENDNKPRFSERLYRIRYPETRYDNADIPLFQVIASDDDEGKNGEITFSIRGGDKDDTVFSIDPETGMVSATKDLVRGSVHHLAVKATDNGETQVRKSTSKIRVEVLERLKSSPNPPRFVFPVVKVTVLEDDPVGQLVELLQAMDDDGDDLWYSITDGDPDRRFAIGLEAGNLLIARKLDYETTSGYNLTVQVTDGVHQDSCLVVVTVIDTNDNAPMFSAPSYHGDVSESAVVGTTILRVKATDADDEPGLLYTLPDCCNSRSSQDLFEVNAQTGAIMVKSPLDREVAVQHNLTVMVRDQDVGAHRNFTRVTINVLDHNDHPPSFLSDVFRARVFETAAIGTSIVQVLAMDQDKGRNAEITYSILSGNVGGTFSIDRKLGTVSVAKELDRDSKSEYNLLVVATDKGRPPLSQTCTVEIQVTMSDNAPPKFSQMEYTAEIHENEPKFTNVFTLSADCRSSLVYQIRSGNEKGKFAINPNSGVLYSNGDLDYEQDRYFNLSVSATSIIHATATTNLLIHIIDENDNAPEFKKEIYFGNVTETAKPGTVVLNKKGTPLVIEATDRDSSPNDLLVYEIRDSHAKDFITIDHNTGAIRTVAELDHEAMDKLEFSVEVWDMGHPQLRAKSPARVVVFVDDVNDTPPKFSQPVYTAEVLLPTYKDVVVLTLHATDDDSGVNSKLKFSIIDGNEAGKFSIDEDNGKLFVVNETGMADNFVMTVQVCDGLHHSTAAVNVAVRKTSDSTIKFSLERYSVTVRENRAQFDTLTVIQVLDRDLNEQLTFRLLNGQDKFVIGRTSGVLRTAGQVFDREEISVYNLVVEVTRSTKTSPEKAHTVVEVTIDDENDCAPMFVNQPYHAVIVYNANPGETVKQVTALDRDAGKNGEVMYEVKGRSDMDDKFEIDADTGKITLSRPLVESDVGKEIMLSVEATDKGVPLLKAHSTVKVTIISEFYPVFEQQVYKASILENSPSGASVISLAANSPTGQKMIYTIVAGDRYGDFDVDFNIGMIIVKGQVDYEMTPSYNLTVQATETSSGLSATTMVIITVQDVNDKKPVFESLSYTATVSEAVAKGTSVTMVTAQDDDSGINGLVHYSIAPIEIGSRDTDFFMIDSETGIITTTLFLDHEDQSEFTFLVVGTDGGVPALSSMATVHVLVSDLNNNAPQFDQASYHCTITDQVKRGQLVTKVSAVDPDTISTGLLRYSIIGGNDRQIFHIQEQNGVISLSEQRKPELHSVHELNISVSDGVFTNFARVTINVRNSNNHTPRFQRTIYVADFPENYGEGMLVTQVIAEDLDPGTYGMLTYSIPSDEMRKYFSVDADSGEIFSQQVFDREERGMYNVPVVATDNGGRMGFTSVHITITDLNDNVPQFLAQEYQATILADTPVNGTVIQVHAEDPDSGANGEIRYSIHTGANSRVAQVFYIDPHNGKLSLRRTLHDSVNEAFRFFVRAVDQGEPKMENNVAVYMWVTTPSSAQPHFPSSSYSFFMLESDPVDTVIATVVATSSVELKHSIVPGYTKGSNSPPKFSIDRNGRIRVAGPLDREETCTYTLTVQAETLGNAPLVAHTEVTIGLLDVNDNYPYFESHPYIVTVAEDTEEGTDLIQVVAHDKDKASKFTYSFSEDMLKYSHIFGIDSSSGLITLLSVLDREEQDLYNLTVWVRDGEDGDALQNSTIVRIHVMDHNDNPPVFARRNYQAAVNEDAYPGTVLLSITTTDRDLPPNRDTRYYIIDGDLQGKFQVSSVGDLFVNGELDRELVPRYKLVIAATDGGFVSTATVTVDILDANDNSPVCSVPMLVTVVSEAVSSTDVIARIKATDADEYGSMKYQLSGNNSDHFLLDRRSGVLTVRSSLDRELIPSYELLAKAVDNGGKSCTTEISLTISDVNDNAPEFVPVPGPVMLSEDAQINTLVYRVSAQDADIGINRKVQYSLKDDISGIFKIDPKSGLIQLAQYLDRETTPSYQLTVIATDQGTPQLSSSMALEVVVLDINDNPPEFEQMTYLATIPEDAEVGQFVTRIRATSRDTGINAQISYYIDVGDDKNNKFTINATTGVISTTGSLDHESRPGYILTVRAQDHGDVPLSNKAYVQINVTDVNDNAPIFAQSVYSTKLREDVQLGTKLLQVMTSDPDSDPANAAVNYTIEGGDHLQMFDINRADGTVTVVKPLDRETVASFVLHVRATNYHLSSDCMVNVEVLDANDCPPRFQQDNYTVFVREDKEITSTILQFTVTDDDLDPNGPPFTFDIIQGDNEREFTLDKHGNLRIASKLNRQVTADYDLVVRVFDNGTPAMYSDVSVKVSVIEESTFPPEVTDLDISISSYLDEFPGGVIGHLKAVDNDKYDTMIYRVVSPSTHLFDFIDKKDGRIVAFAGLDAGTYKVNVSVSDGKYTTHGRVNIEVNSVTEEMINNAITIQFGNVSPQDFVRLYKKDFQRVLKKEMSVRARDVEVISIQTSDDIVDLSGRPKRSTAEDLDVLFAVKRSPDSYLRPNNLRRKVLQAVPALEQTLGIGVLKVFSDVCQKDFCEGGECAGYVEFDKDSLVQVLMDSGSFVAAKHRYSYECVCPNGFVGDNCLQNPTSCDQNPCPRYKICKPNFSTGYQCVCPEGKTGRRCEKDVDNKCSDTNCLRGDSPITFSGDSYARWTLSEAIDSRLSLTVRFKTRKLTASLMYAKGRVDYSILELVNGKIQYRFDCGSGQGLVMIPNVVSDGAWHTVMVERRGNQAEIFLDGQYSAITMAPGINDVLNLDTSDVYFGAEVEVYATGYVDVRNGFNGCMEDIRIYNVRLPISGSNPVALSQEFSKVDFSCQDADFVLNGNNACGSSPCMNGGKCENTKNSHLCKCGHNYRGKNCEIDDDPCREKPCLNNGKCENVRGVPNEFHCECAAQHKGRRCEFGRFCLPNPCLHGGSCIEGPSNFMCMCRTGYDGIRCETTVNFCDSDPCLNGGVCIQESSSFLCNCSDGYVGVLCENTHAEVYPSITSNKAGINPEEIFAIIGGVLGLILLVLIFVLVRVWRRRKRNRRHGNITAGIANDGNEVFLNLLKDDKHNYKTDTNKLENIKTVNVPPSPRPPPVPDRPASYTPSGQADSLNALNNFDSLRNYGSAADELENIPNIPYNLEFLQTFAPPRSVASIPPSLPPPPPSNPATDCDSLQKEPWEFACQNILENYMADKHSDKLSKLMPVGTVAPMSRLQGQDTTSFSSLPISESEDDLPGYHWDTSDWAPEKPLPNISEIPTNECPDSPGSSSPHSNESNNHIAMDTEQAQYTDGEYIDSEYVGDSECAENEYDLEDMPMLPNYEQILAEQNRLLQEDYELPQHGLNVHPNLYLPNHSFNSADQSAEGLESWPAAPPPYDDVEDSDASRSASEEGDTDSVLHYGFPSQYDQNRLSAALTDSEYNDNHRLSAAYTTDSEFNGDYNRRSIIDDVSMGGRGSTNASVSDISGLCEIEDSEVNLSEESDDENTPLPTQRLHTDV